mgnify:CR=1 FL=1
MLRSCVIAIFALSALPALGYRAHAAEEATPFADIAGMSLGQRPQAVAWLTPAAKEPPDCPREILYRPTDPERRFSVVGVPLAWPGLVYRFIDDKLHAVEGPLSTRDHAFARLLNALTRRYGRPDVRETWAGSPSDSFVYRHRLQMAGWFGPGDLQSLWLTGHDEGGSIILTRRLSATAPSPGFRSSCGANTFDPEGTRGN